MKYKQLTTEQRYAIFAYKQSDKSNSEIAELIGVHRSTVCRELKRNSDKRNGEYKAELAERKHIERIKNRKHYVKFTDSIKSEVVGLLCQDYSPEQICGRLALNKLDHVSHETIYKFIWADKKNKNGLGLYLHLRRNGKRNHKRGGYKSSRGIVGRVDIDMRPKIVDEKKRFGDLEIDTVIGKNHKGALLTINDRASGLLWIRLLTGKEANPVADETVKALHDFRHQLHTITADNGKEFARHADIAQALGVDVYFAHPYHSWERGANENTNGLIRQYFPKGTDFAQLTHEDVARVQDIINNRPRKRLGFKTPMEAFCDLVNLSYDSVALSS